jgi:hypothetical protein
MSAQLLKSISSPRFEDFTVKEFPGILHNNDISDKIPVEAIRRETFREIQFRKPFSNFDPDRCAHKSYFRT